MRAAAMIGCDSEAALVVSSEIIVRRWCRRARTAYRADVNGGAADATAGRFLIFFFAGTAGIVWSATWTGFGVSFGEEKTDPSSERTDTVSDWYPASAKVTESSGATWMVSSQGVRQLCPEGVFTSAPAGSDSNRTAAVGGDEFRKFRLGTDAEQAATVNPHAMTAMTRLIITPPLWRLRAAIPRTRPRRTARERSPTKSKAQGIA